jgi:predicted kinase
MPVMSQQSTRQTKPVVYLLVGLPGSGKSTYARRLEAEGIKRLSVDEETEKLNGRFGIDYLVSEHVERQKPVLEWVRRHLIELLCVGKSVVLDHGLGQRSEREEYKKLVEMHGGTWRLLHFKTERLELLRRLSERNMSGKHPVTVTPELLDFFIAHSEEPQGEGEEEIRS